MLGPWYEQPRAATAIHEASHAVVAERLGLCPTRASIRPDADSNGRVFHSHGPWRDEILVCLAGSIGASLFYLGTAQRVDGDQADHEEVMRLLRAHSKNPEHELAELTSEATRLVLSHKRAIAELAQLLLRDEELFAMGLWKPLERLMK
jgi:hypothetical protein